jgi:predicted CXXCH cytochrome family protein
MRKPLRIGWLLVGAIVGAPLLPSAPNQLEAQTPKHDCSSCHNLHGGSYSALSDYAVAEELCLTCHGDGGPPQAPKQEGIHDGPKHSTPTSCWNCHDHEGSAGLNLFMIPETRADLPQGGSATVTFQNNAAQADFIGSEGVCYVCHTDPATQANGFAGHNGPDVCTTCHSHSGGFQGAGGGCSGCHNSTRLADGHTHAPRRQVTGTGGDYDRTSVHVTSATDDDCVVCHDQRTDHSTDDFGVLLYDHDDGTSIELTHDGDPNTNSTEAAKLEQFCLGCHGDGSADKTGVTFPTGASATQPFTSLATIPDVDSLVWAAPPHPTRGISPAVVTATVPSAVTATVTAPKSSTYWHRPSSHPIPSRSTRRKKASASGATPTAGRRPRTSPPSSIPLPSIGRRANGG